MGKYLKEFELTSQYEEYINSTTALLPNVSLTNDDNMVHYNPYKAGPNYLKFTAEEDNSMIAVSSVNAPDIKYSLNGGEWTQWDYNSAITLNTGDTVRMKGNNSNGFNTHNSYNKIWINGKIGASGNIMSLLYEDDFEGKLTIPCEYCFCNMFMGCTGLTTAPELPATTLTERCYYGMFDNCTSLTTTPTELPATTLADSCYVGMFAGCRSLTTPPELPATTLAYVCYAGMFMNCTSLTTAPELPATTLVEGCYNNMFQNCTSLTTAPELPATILGDGCYSNMFSGCTSLTIAPELPATTLNKYCYSSMFGGCTSLTTAPELPATTLATNCYQQMFRNCSELNYIKMLATDVSATDCLKDWTDGVSSTGTFVKHPSMTSLETGVSGIPEGWTVEDAA